MNNLLRCSLIFLLLILSIFEVKAQRITYQQLVNRSEQPDIFIKDIVIPGEDSTVTLAFMFHFSNDFIPFKKLQPNDNISAPDNEEYYSTIRLNAEIFEGKLRNRTRPSNDAIARATWSDTLFAKTFDNTQSNKIFTNGMISTSLTPGEYNFILQLNMMQETNERNTRRRSITIRDFRQKFPGEVYLIKNSSTTGNEVNLDLYTMEYNVPFGEDFKVLIRLPNYSDSVNFDLRINRAEFSSGDTTMHENIYTVSLNDDMIFKNSTVTIKDSNTSSFLLKQGDYEHTYALVDIPASTFENASYMITVDRSDMKIAASQGRFRSYWPDMPASLYNLNIAIDNLRFIVGEDVIEKIKQGSRSERERKFRAFWDARDPTPNTVFNELMAEYYRRIDYAYKNFSSQEMLMGHESDQGEVYIKFGPPTNKERQFPTNGRTREIWTYPNRTFVFEAASGFGDFKLIGTQ